jgi:hypothetical protein
MAGKEEIVLYDSLAKTTKTVTGLISLAYNQAVIPLNVAE